MQQEYIKAIIGGAATILSAIITLIVKNWLDNAPYPSIKGKRSITGNWKGRTTQDDNKIVNVTGKITSKSKKIKGEARIEWEGEKYMDLKIKGNYLDEDHVLINYHSVDSNVKNYGSQILKISANCKKLQGYTIGFGSEAEEIIRGETILDKI
jgi:hypothetical protein